MTTGVLDKVLTEQDVVARLSDGMTLGIGGWGGRRKPMSLVRAILRSDLTDLRIVSFGGPDVGMLCAAGKVRELVFAFVSLDAIALEPWFRAARENRTIDVRQVDEGMMTLGLQAAAWRVPFLPTRAGLGTDVLTFDPDLRTVTSPYPGPDGGPGEELVAMPALELDAAIVHVNRADRIGNGQILDVDPFFDELFLGAAAAGYVSCEDLGELDGDFRTYAISRRLVDGVVHAPGGSHPTSCLPDVPWDVPAMQAYVNAASDTSGWAGYRDAWLGTDEADYRRRIEEAR